MIGNILRYIRICNDLSTHDIAHMVGISVAFVSAIETNKKTPSLERLNKFADCYNIETSKILYLVELEQKGKDRKEILKEILEYYIVREKSENKSL